MKKDKKEILIQTLKNVQRYCEEQNGLPYCKNCGIYPQEILYFLDDVEEIKTQKLQPYPNYVCVECGMKYTKRKAWDDKICTFRKGICDICKIKKSVTHVENYNYPHFPNHIKPYLS